MIAYEKLVSYFKRQRIFKINIKKNYFVLTLPKYYGYHITVFQDQWDDYELQTNMPYHLFHISSEMENKCSSYFWIDKEKHKIRTIPSTHFRYEQDDYGFYSSTRKPCDINNKVRVILKQFERSLVYIQ